LDGRPRAGGLRDDGRKDEARNECHGDGGDPVPPSEPWHPERVPFP
jgi:hypothetical protein